MESFEKSNVSKESLLEPPSLVDFNADEEDVKPTIKPRLSPLPRRRSSVSSDDGDLEPPTTVARKVSFADAFGFDLVSVKEFDKFDTWELPTLSQDFVMESIKIEEFYLTPSFILPPVDGIMERLYTKKVTLESVDFIPSTTSMKGIIRVLNLSYEKQIYVRMSLDNWQTHYDLLAEYLPDSCNGKTDQFFFTISLVSPYQKEGAQVEFCICYETAVGTFWDNNEGLNYVLTCQKKEHIVEVNTPSEITEDVSEINKKSCLKPVPSKEDEDFNVFEAESPATAEKYIPTIHCSYDEFSEDSNGEVKEDNSKGTNNEEESDLEMFLSRKLMNARITSSEEKQSIGYSEEATLQNKRDLDEEIKYISDNGSNIVGQEPKECDESREYLPLTLAISPLTAKDLPCTPNADSHSVGHEVLSVKSLSKTEDIDFCFHDQIPTNQITKKEQISSGKKDHLQETGTEQLSMTEDQSKHSSNISLAITESTSNPEPGAIKFTEILDDNANLSYNENKVNMPYFSTGATKGLKEDKKEIDKTETMGNSFTSNTASIYNLKEDDELLVLTENMKQECPISCSQTEDSQDLVQVLESTNNTAFNAQQKNLNESIIESQVKNTGDEIRKNTDLIVSFCEDSKTIHDISETSVESQFVSTEKETCFPTLPKLVAKEYYVTSQDGNFCLCDHEKDVYDTHDNKNVVLSENSEQCDVEYPLYNKEETDIYETDITVPGACGITDFKEQELSYQKVTLPECPSSVAFTAVENMTPNTSHAWKELLGCDPSEVTQGSKVIIAKITEEKGQSEKHSQGEKKPLYIDIGDSGYVKAQKQICEESKQKCILVSEASIEPSSEINLDMSNLSIDNLRDNNHMESENINTSKFKNLAEKDIILEHEECISKEQYEIHCDHRPNSLDAEPDVHHLDANPITQSDNNLAVFVDNTDTGNNINGCAKAKKETIEFTDLPELTITEDSKHTDNVHDSGAESNTGPFILISEPDDEGLLECRETEEQNKLEDTLQSLYPLDDYELQADQHMQCDTKVTEHLNINDVRSKVLCFIMFVVFAGLMYKYDFLVCFALYLFSLYWLYWEGDKGTTSVRKE